METATDGDDWDDPRLGHSWLDPAGPFRPVRRLLLYGFVIVLVITIAGTALGSFSALSFGVVVAPSIGSLWLGLWFLDTILAFLKR